MGAYLSSPVTDKDSHGGENENFRFGVACMQGWRTEMEDAHLIEPAVGNDNSVGFFAVFDGHGGKEVAGFAALYLVREFLQTEGYKTGDIEAALREGFLRIDNLLVKEEHAAELKKLAAAPNPSDVRRGGSRRVERPESDLPLELREVIGAARAEIESRFLALDNALGPMAADVEEVDDPESGPDTANNMQDMDGTVVTMEEFVTAEFATGVDMSTQQDVEGQQEREISSSSEDRSPKDGEGRSSLKPKRKRDVDSEDTANRNGNARREPGQGRSLVNGVTHSKSDNDGTSSKQANAADALSSSSSSSSSEEDSGDDGATFISIKTRSMRQLPGGGCTAVAALVKGGILYVANAGDSRCVFSRRGRAVAMTTDHKPTDPAELARIIKAGGFVADGRVNASLNLSRALGDLEYKQSVGLGPEEQMVTAVPEVRHMQLQQGDDFLLLACDGIWDVLSNQEAVDFVASKLQQGMSPKDVCEALCDRCMAPDTETDGGKGCDNMSAMVIVLKPYCEIAAAVTPMETGDSSAGALGAGPSTIPAEGLPSVPAEVETSA
eukprot:jgi/Botrbrau1/8984/Bobra.0148s0090.1